MENGTLQSTETTTAARNPGKLSKVLGKLLFGLAIPFNQAHMGSISTRSDARGLILLTTRLLGTKVRIGHDLYIILEYRYGQLSRYKIGSLIP